jgi:two-component system response regulator ResD
MVMMIPRVLVADDDDGVRQLLRLIFTREGFEVIEAANGEQTLARAVDSDPSVILLDIMMPGMDGYDTCRRLKDDRRTLGVPVIFVSAMEDRTGRVVASHFGAEDWIKKPVSPRDLVARVRGVLERRGTAFVT